jgi:5,10-methylenetetrahydromethanopterin reductase
MRIGMMHGDDGSRTLEQQIQQVVDEEKAGFEVAWFGQTFGADSLMMIAMAGQRTSKIEFGTAIIPTYPRHPFTTAQQALTAQIATNGRFTLGIGPSHHMVVENMWGMSYEKPARHVREYLGVLLPLLRERKVSFSGETYRAAGNLTMQQVAPPPVIISALAPVMLKLAGGVADGTVTWMTGPKTIETHVVPGVTVAAKEAGKPAPRVVVSLPVCVTDDVAAAREAAAKIFAVYGYLPNYRRMLDKEGASGPADVAMVGNAAQVEAQIRNVAGVGATDLNAIVFPSGTDARSSMTQTTHVLKSLIRKV